MYVHRCDPQSAKILFSAIRKNFLLYSITQIHVCVFFESVVILLNSLRCEYRQHVYIYIFVYAV